MVQPNISSPVFPGVTWQGVNIVHGNSWSAVVMETDGDWCSVILWHHVSATCIFVYLIFSISHYKKKNLRKFYPKQMLVWNADYLLTALMFISVPPSLLTHQVRCTPYHGKPLKTHRKGHRSFTTLVILKLFLAVSKPGRDIGHERKFSIF
jgi:hypothetical protein